MTPFDLPAAFSFEMTFTGPGRTIPDVTCPEVSGLGAQIATEPLTEGGENDFVHRIPKASKSPPLVLKRIVTATSSDLVTWCKDILEGGFAKPIEPLDMEIRLRDRTGDLCARWSLTTVFPVKWTMGQFDAQSGEIVIETLEMSYGTVKRTA